MSLLLFSVQNAFRKKSAAVLAVLGVAFGTALMTFLLSLAAGMEGRADKTLSELSNRVMVTGKDAIFGGLFFGMGTSPIPASYADAIADLPHVEKVYHQVAAIMRPEGVNYVMPLYGYAAEEISSPGSIPHNRIIEGTAPASDSEIIVGKSLKEYLKLLNSPCETGRSYRFGVPEKGKTRVLELKVVGVYQTGNEVLDGAFAGSERLARDIGRVPAEKVSAISVLVDRVDNVESAAHAIQAELAGKLPEVQVVVPTEVLNPVKNVLDIFSRFLLVVSLAGIVAGGLSITVVMLLSVAGRMREFGILKALGWTPANVVCMVLVESLVLSISGALLGMVLGYCGLVAAGFLIAPDIAALNWKVAAGVGLAGILIGVAGGIYPARRANRAAPAKILRDV
ncbi:MAG: ABC transporter permease [Peptococcaceae bacterium]|nr:ABC transporter permease [Peptococcaceae bacterium]